MFSRLGLMTMLINCGVGSMALILAAFCLLGVAAVLNWRWRISALGYVVIGIISFMAGMSASTKFLHWGEPPPSVSQLRVTPPGLLAAPTAPVSNLRGTPPAN